MGIKWNEATPRSIKKQYYKIVNRTYVFILFSFFEVLISIFCVVYLGKIPIFFSLNIYTKSKKNQQQKQKEQQKSDQI